MLVLVEEAQEPSALDELDGSARALAREYVDYYVLLEEVLGIARGVADRRAGS